MNAEAGFNRLCTLAAPQDILDIVAKSNSEASRGHALAALAKKVGLVLKRAVEKDDVAKILEQKTRLCQTLYS